MAEVAGSNPAEPIGFLSIADAVAFNPKKK